MDDFVRTMHTKSALLPAIEASTLTLADAGAQVARVHPRPTCPSAGHRRRCAATRSASTAASSTPAPRARPLPALPQHRRVELQGALPALVPRRLQEAAGQGGDPPGARRRRSESIAELRYYREHMLRARAETPTPSVDAQRQELAQGAQERGDRALARRVAHEPDAPRLAGELAEAAADLDAVGRRAAPCAASASSAPSGSHAVVSSGRRWPSGTTSRNPRLGQRGLEPGRRRPGGGPRRLRDPRRARAPSAACSAKTIETGAVWW